MSLVESLLTAIVRLDGDALVMHVGEKPYVVTTAESANAFRGPLSWGQVELSTRVLTVDAVAGMVDQLLPEDQRAILSDIGAVEYELPPHPTVSERFTVIAARGGDDIWLEVRHRRPEPVAPVAVAPAPAAELEIAEPVASEPAIAEPAIAEPAIAEPEPAELATAELATAESATVELEPAELATAEPATAEPATVELATVELATVELATAEPATVELATAEPAASEPAEAVSESPPPAAWTPEPAEAAPPVDVAGSEETIAHPAARVEPAAAALASPAPEVQLIDEAHETAAPIAHGDDSDVEIVLELEPADALALFPAAPAVAASAPEAQGSEEEGVYDLSLNGLQEEEIGLLIPPATARAKPEPVAVEPAEIAPAAQAEIEAEPTRAPAAEVIETAAAEPDVPLEAVPFSGISPVRPAVVLPLTRPGVRGERAADGAVFQRTTLDRLLRVAAARGASALYVVTDTRPAIRVDGEIQILDGEEALGPADVATALMELAPEPSQQALQKGAVTEWIIDVEEVGRVRCMSFHDHRGQGGIFRMLPARALSVEQLGLSREIQALCREADGLVLVAGPRSSGKSTLMSAFVDLINRTRADHVITLEGQIKFVHESRRSLVSQRELRGDAAELRAAVRAALREDPDVLVIEDLRSADLMAAALEAAESGRLVFGALPATSTVAAIERIVDQFPQERRAAMLSSLATTLRGVVTQVLLRKIGGGRVAAREILLNTPSVAALIAEGQTRQLSPALDTGRKIGMAPLNDALVAFVRSGAVAPAEAYRKSADREGLLVQLRREGVDTSFVERLA